MSNQPKIDALSPQRAGHLKQVFADLPHDFEERTTTLAAIGQEFHHEMAAQLQTALKDAMKKKPHSTYEDKKQFSKWLNGELRRHGLAISCKVQEVVNGTIEEKIYPGIMVIDTGDHPDEGRFRFQCKTDDGRRVRPLNTPDLSALLANFEVMADDPDRRRWGKWVSLENQVPAQTFGNGKPTHTFIYIM